MKLLIVDGDRDFVEMLTAWLKALGHEVRRAYTGEQARKACEEQHPDLVILETLLKDTDALALCWDLREKYDTLVIVVTEENDFQHEIRCLDAGADDYLRKPFFPTQLLARIRAVSRRGRPSLALQPDSVITVGPLCVDSLHHEVTAFGKTAHLTKTESKLLYLLAVNANAVCTANQIVSYIWGPGNDGETSLIKAHIHHVRHKIEPDPDNPHYLLTVPGVGYMLLHRGVEEALTSLPTP